MTPTFEALDDLATRMEARLPRGFTVSPETAPLVVAALCFFARERGRAEMGMDGYGVDAWDVASPQVIRRLAYAADLAVARAAYAAAIKARPGERVTLRQGERVIEGTR